jgi:hypothetical protein
MAWSTEGDPRKAAFRRIQRMLVDQDVKHGPLLSMATVSVMTRSWNMWRRGEEADAIMTKSREGWIPPVRPI